jgi:hypothetical protein
MPREDISCISNTLPLQFIADIRGARVKELEEKRINKEMANIRKKFKGSCLAIVLYNMYECEPIQMEIWTDIKRRSVLSLHLYTL